MKAAGYMPFKFQSDSINTAAAGGWAGERNSLNSNLILLIQKRKRLWQARHSPLNSNLILLILMEQSFWACLTLTLNSNLILLIHYKQSIPVICVFPLNSNLILLILIWIINASFFINNFKFQSDSINTISEIEKTGAAAYFKFQSDSINTLAYV